MQGAVGAVTPAAGQFKAEASRIAPGFRFDTRAGTNLASTGSPACPISGLGRAVAIDPGMLGSAGRQAQEHHSPRIAEVRALAEVWRIGIHDLTTNAPCMPIAACPGTGHSYR